jgi:hypothetical protein
MLRIMFTTSSSCQMGVCAFPLHSWFGGGQFLSGKTGVTGFEIGLTGLSVGYKRKLARPVFRSDLVRSVLVVEHAQVQGECALALWEFANVQGALG